MADFKELKQFIADHRADVTTILESERLNIANAAEIKILHSKYLIDFWKNRVQQGLNYIICFSEQDAMNLAFEQISAALAGEITEQLKTHNVLQVNHEFKVTNKSFEKIVFDQLEELSKQELIVFFFGEEGIDLGIRGRVIDRINFFYNEADRLKFLKKYHISNLDECLKEYETYVAEPGVNEAFFVSSPTVARIQPVSPPNNILVNKPENVLRNNLLSFLNRNTQHTFSKENELNNKRELDLYTEVEGKKYLIEVKWLGQSINDTDDGFSQRVTDVAARDGVTQTLEYIQHLFEKMNYIIHTGYLCVFDVRENKRVINYRNFEFITPELMPYYQQHFIKLNEIKVERNP